MIAVNVPHIPGEYIKEDVDLPGQKLGPLIEDGLKMRQRILETFDIKDYNLFVNNEDNEE